jgi:hypothetical protein
VSGSSSFRSVVNYKRGKSKTKRPTKVPIVADERVYSTNGSDRRRRRMGREGGEVHDDVIDSIDRGGSVQLESIGSARHVLGAIDSSKLCSLNS